MAKTNKVVNVLSVAALAGMVLSTNAFAAVDSYSVKVGSDVFSYDKTQLTDSFLADKAGNADGSKLFKDFAAKLDTAKSFYAFHDDKSNKYIDFTDITNAFLADKEKFNLDDYVAKDTAKVVADLPAVVKVVSVDKGEVKVTETPTGDKVAVDVRVASVSAINNTTVLVTLKEVPAQIDASKFAFNNDLKVVNAAFKQDNKNQVVITTSAQDAAKDYKLSYEGKESGYSFKGLAVATTPTGISFAAPSNSAKVGTQYVATAKVTAMAGQSLEGIPVTFNIKNDNTLNQNVIQEVLTNKEGVATYAYTRYAAGVDQVQAYATGAPTLRAIGNAYWGVQDILTVTRDTILPANNELANLYKVKFTNPITGAGLANAKLNVTFAENIDADPLNNTSATIGNQLGASFTTPYQTTTGQQGFDITTDANGNASFVVKGINTKATPIVFVDDNTSVFYGAQYNTLNNIPSNLVGNKNQRLDATELQVTAAPLEFVAAQSKYSFTVDKTAPTTGAFGLTNFQEYKVTLLGADGKPSVGTTIYASFNELTDNNFNTNTTAQFVTSTGALIGGPSGINQDGDVSGNAQKIRITTNSLGQATIRVASDALHGGMVTATPVVWVDLNNIASQNGTLEVNEPQLTIPSVTFVNQAITGGSVGIYNDYYDVSYKGPFVSGDKMKVDFTVVNQSGNEFESATTSLATVTYVITNTSNAPIIVKPQRTSTFIMDDVNMETTGIQLNSGSSCTVKGMAIGNVRTTTLDIPVLTRLDGTKVVNGSISVYATGVTKDTQNINQAMTLTGSVETASFVGANYTTTATGKIVGFAKADKMYNGTAGYGRVIVELDGTPGTYAAVVYDANSNIKIGTDGTFTNGMNFNPSDANGLETVITLNDRINVDVVNNVVNFRIANLDLSNTGVPSGNKVVTPVNPIADINAATNVDAMKLAIEKSSLNLVNYNKLDTFAKLTVAQAVLNNKATGYANVVAVQAQLDVAVTAQTNQAAPALVNAATTVDAMKLAIEGSSLDLVNYNKLDTFAKLTVAKEVLAKRPVAGYANIAAVQIQLDAQVTKALATTKVAAVKASLTLSANGTEYNGTDSAIIVPTTVDGTTITWNETSDAANVATLNGNAINITRSDVDAMDDVVSYTATITVDGVSDTKVLTFTVKAAEKVAPTVKITATKVIFDDLLSKKFKGNIKVEGDNCALYSVKLVDSDLPADAMSAEFKITEANGAFDLTITREAVRGNYSLQVIKDGKIVKTIPVSEIL